MGFWLEPFPGVPRYLMETKISDISILLLDVFLKNLDILVKIANFLMERSLILIWNQNIIQRKNALYLHPKERSFTA